MNTAEIAGNRVTARIADYQRVQLSCTTNLNSHYDEATTRVAERLERWLRLVPAFDYVAMVSSFGVAPKTPPLIALCLEHAEKVANIKLPKCAHLASFGGMRGAGILRAFYAFMIGRYKRGIIANDLGIHVDLFLLDKLDEPGLRLSNYRSRRTDAPEPAASYDRPTLPVEQIEFDRFARSATIYAFVDRWFVAIDVD